MAVIDLKKGWIKIPKKERDQLCQQIYRKYQADGGQKELNDFNTHLPNYDSLISFVEQNLIDYQVDNKCQIKINGQTYSKIAPGKTFLKHFFYTKRTEEKPQFQRVNIDICYLYAFGQTRESFLLSTKQEQQTETKITLPNTNKKVADFHILLSYTFNNLHEAQKIENYLKDNFNISVSNDIRNSPIYNTGEIDEIYKKLPEDSYIINLLSRDYLQNEHCVKSLIDITSRHTSLFMRKTINIFLLDIYDGEYNIFSTMGQIALSVHWKLHIEKLEKIFSDHLEYSPSDNDEVLKDIAEKINELKFIKSDIFDMLHLITKMKSSIRYDMFFQKVSSLSELEQLLPRALSDTTNDKFEKLYNSIQVPSSNDPSKPEFPPAPFYTPQFPASSTYRLEVEGFSNVWIKDESSNPSGTHKDRLAWEVVIKYKALLESIKYQNNRELPQMSVISSGGAATAIQNLFNVFQIPVRLKVLIDHQLDPKMKQSLQELGCELYETDLSEKLLKPNDIKLLTDNTEGIDITYRETLDPNMDNYYDWLSYEIINQQPDYCFVPFGTGDLFINVLNIVKKEYFNSFVKNHDPRFNCSLEHLRKCHFMAATTHDKETKLDKLFSSYLPSFNAYEKFIDELKSYACVGNETAIYELDESLVTEASALGKAQGVTFEPSGIAGLALLLQMQDEIPSDSKILIVNTGKTKYNNELN